MMMMMMMMMVMMIDRQYGGNDDHVGHNDLWVEFNTKKLPIVIVHELVVG